MIGDRRLRGAAVLLLACLLVALIVGGAWRSTAGSTDYGKPPARAALADLRAVASEGPPRHIEIPPGWRAEQVAGALEQAGIGDGRRFLSLVTDPGRAKLAIPGSSSPISLEGYLFPGIYDIGPGFSEQALAAEMVARFRLAFTPSMRRRARALGLSVHDAVTLASIVQRELVFKSEAPAIAAVYHNRLRARMPLQADPTVIYALESLENELGDRYWQRGLSLESLRVDSPYNTYRRRGLPPGPIASPGQDALLAVLYPAFVDYRYFVAKGDNTHSFARSYRDHLANVQRYSGRGLPVKERPSGLQRIVRRLVEPLRAHVGVVVKNLATGEAVSVNADDYFTAASLYKLAVLVKAFDERERGRLDFRERLAIGPDALASDVAEVQARLGTRPTVGKALGEMIGISSNAAGVTLLRRFGRRSVDRLLRGYGLEKTSLSSIPLVTTPRDVAHLLELIATGRAVSRQASAAMVRLLLGQEIRDRLPKYLPGGVRLAHKTGNIDYPSHDAGILFGRRGPIVIVAMTEEAANGAAAAETIAELGRLVFDYFEFYEPAAKRAEVERGNAACPASPFRPRRPGVLAGRTIVLDPGHGGTDRGAAFRFRDGFVLTEKDVVLDVSLQLRDLLTARGATVHMTRCRDVFVPRMLRAARANRIGPAAVVSVHVNASPRSRKDGTELYWFRRGGQVLASHLLGTFARPALWETLAAHRALPNRGLHRRQFDVLAFSLAPTALTESLFLTAPAEAALLREGGERSAGGGLSRRAQIARGHLRGLLNYFGVVKTLAGGTSRSPREARPAPTADAVAITAVGDIALSAMPRADGPAALFEHVASHLSGDVVLGNLEGTFATGGRSKCGDGARPPGCYAFRAPPEYVASLAQAGFTVLNVANNHAHDFGPEGFGETVDALDGAGILHTGRPGQMARLEAGGIRVAVVGFAPGPGSQNLLDLAAAKRLVARADTWADVVVVTMHAGGEGRDRQHVRRGAEVYLGEPRGDPVAFAHAVVDAGADLVVGHGPHVVRGLEWYRGRLIAHSLGNFAAHQTLSLDGPLALGGLLRVTLRGDGSWGGGRLIGVRLVDEGTPVLDRNGAVRSLVQRLSREDFGGLGVRVSATGALLRPQLGAKGLPDPAAVRVTDLTPREKAALVVVSGLPAPPGVGGVFVERWTHALSRPPGALVLAEQEGGEVNALDKIGPSQPPSSYTNPDAAFAEGREAGLALTWYGVHLDLAPAVDPGSEQFGSRRFRHPSFAAAFARGLAASGVGACAKHFPGPGPPALTSEGPEIELLTGFRAAIRAGVPCVLVGHALHPRLGTGPASLEPAAYRLLRKYGFRGVALTDDLTTLGRSNVPRLARLALVAGADLVLVTAPDEARRAIEALVPLARRGTLDRAVARVLDLRRAFGVPGPE